MSLWKLLVILALVLGFVLADHGGGKKPKKEKKEKKPKKKYKDPYLTGIRYRNSNKIGRLDHVSMAGGLELFIKGKGFANEPNSNTVTFTTTIDPIIDLIGPPLELSDEVQSKPSRGFLAYQIPPITDLYNLPIEAFGSYLLDYNRDYIEHKISIYNQETEENIACKQTSSKYSEKCAFRYSFRYTPQLYAVSPSNVYYNQLVDIFVNPGAANDKNCIPMDQEPVSYIKFKKSRGNKEYLYDKDKRLSNYYLGNLKIRSADQLPGNSPLEVRFRVGDAYKREAAKQCNFAGDDCWFTKTHPLIESVSAHSGFVSGGTTLTIDGYGLEGTTIDDVDVTIDGVPCVVTHTSIDQITCVTGAADEVSTCGVSQPGQPGLTQQVLDPVNNKNPYWEMRTDGLQPVVETKLLTAFENSYNDLYRDATLTKGWFKAPASGNYRFYIACDDACRLYLDATNKYDKSNFVEPVLDEFIANRVRATQWRNYFLEPSPTDQSQYRSDWIALEEGEFYKIEGFMMEYTSYDHFTVSVEFEASQAETAGHPLAGKEVQLLEINPDNTFEKFTITVEGADDGKFMIQFMNPKEDDDDRRMLDKKDKKDKKDKEYNVWMSKKINNNGNIWHFRDAFVHFFYKYWGSNVSVEQVRYDENDQVTTVVADTVKSIYTVTVLKTINGPSFAVANIIPVGHSDATVTIQSPFQQSTPPMSGNFKVMCPDDNGTEFFTRELGFSSSPASVNFWIQQDIPHLQFKTYVDYTGKHMYHQNGISFQIQFSNYFGDVPQCELVSGTNHPLFAYEASYEMTTVREFGVNLFFQPVPLEFIYTDVQKPQILVSVNGIVAVCPHFNCDFAYEGQDGLITGQSLTDGVLTIVGTDLPTDDVSVMFANTHCASIVATPTEITCELTSPPTAGSFNAIVTSEGGQIPFAAGVDPIDVPLVVTSVLPNVDLNPLGGDLLTITGSGFDPTLADTVVTFSEDGTVCTILTVTPTQIWCTTEAFDQGSIDPYDPTYTLSVSVNDVVNTDLSVTLEDLYQAALSIFPESVSPVLVNTLCVTLDPNYPETLTSTDEFTAQLVGQTDPTYSVPLFVISVDDSDKTLKIKFPGAPSGIYNIQLTGDGVGRIDEEPLVLTVEGVVTNISPLSGSMFGGTLLTIQGINFSENILENPVNVGDFPCDVLTATTTELTCRIRETFVESTNCPTVPVLVFLKTAEDARMDTDNDFSCYEPVATITDLTNAFDTATNTQVITLTGSGFGTDTSAIDFFIDGVRQEVLTVTDTTATFTLDGALDESSDDVQIYFPEGYATGYADFQSITVVPSLVSVSPFSGSYGGTLLTVTGTGFGVDTQDVGIILESTGTDICISVEILGYGSFTCITEQREVSSSDNLFLKTASGTHMCVNTLNPTDCFFEQVQATSPQLTGGAVVGNTLVLTGLNFITSDDYRVLVLFQGVESDLVVVDSSTQLTATFNNGFAFVPSDPPIVIFIPIEDRRRRLQGGFFGTDSLFAWDNGGFTFDPVLTVTDSTSGLSCSFQGGCTYTVTAAGVTATFLLDNEGDYLDVCGEECVIDENASDAAQMTCTLPYLATSYSAETFMVVKESNLIDGTWTGTATEEQLENLYDGLNMNDLEDTTATDCFFQIQYHEDQVGVLNEVSIFLNEIIDKTPYDGNLKFQGSDDGTNFDDLWLLDATVHEGWNYKEFDDAQPSYNIYRFQGAVSGSCRIGEVRLQGVKAIDNDDQSYSCTPTLYVADAETDLNPVTFDTAFTPVLTGMSSRFASVLGGEQLEFYGTGFASGATTSVLIDDRECVIDSLTVDTITCTTSDKPYVPDMPKLDIYIDGKGLTATMEKVVRYVSLWSEPQTWGFDIAPIAGDAVYIPIGRHLLVDVDTTPILSFVNVEGSLIFPPDADTSHQRSFDAKYIIVKGGYMEAGTEDERYTSKLTITMHSEMFDTHLPIFGNKVIGVYDGTLEMHGIERPVTWSDLWETADVGATSITLNYDETLDWAVGEEIVIASTDFSGRNAEQRTIETITQTGARPVITFTEPLAFKHYGNQLTFGADSIEMRAEVGLLTRNVKYQGDATSADQSYGASIQVTASDDEQDAKAKIDSVELFRVGQAFILGAYPINFSMLGKAYESYVRNNAIHQTYNRAVTIRGVHYLRVQNNVTYKSMGHTIFFEDAAETKNLIEDNCVIDVRRSWSLLNTDQTPASFWITNPDNEIRNNHAAGSDRYGFWYNLQTTAIGPSFDSNICPENVQLGEFSDNVAHSNAYYGLRIFNNHLPRTFPCERLGAYDPNDAANPYPENPLIPAVYRNLVAYKNGRDGAIIERAGAVEWTGFKTADNGEAGMEFSTVKEVEDGFALITDGLVIGRTENSEEFLDELSPVGIKNPRTENFTIKNVRFYNYDWNNAAGMGTCSHCQSNSSTDSGARTVTVEDLDFDSTVQKYVDWTVPQRTIFYDKTGSLTAKGPNSWLAPYWKHLLQPECTNDDLVGGITCDSSVQIRRIFFSRMPSNFNNKRLKITQLDRNDENAMDTAGELEDYLDSQDNYSVVPMFSGGWAMPYVTGHRYRLHWEAALDFDTMYLQASERWESTDENIFLVFNFTQSREAVNFTSPGNVQNADESLVNKLTQDLVTGDNLVKNETEFRTFEFVVNAKDESYNDLTVRPLECISGTCFLEELETIELEAGQRQWSDPNSWETGFIPVEGDEVEIMSGVNMILDLQETPILKSLTINGRLTFLDLNLQPVHLRTEQIFVRAGELIIGSEAQPYESEATITLMGRAEAETLRLTGTVYGSNKVLAVTGKLNFYGASRGMNTVRLMVSAATGDTDIFVETDPGWQIGDQIYLAPTAMQSGHSEYRTITDIQNGMILTLDEPLDYYHYGEGSSTASEFGGVDMRGEVHLLSRNIKIQGEDRDGWGGQVLGTDLFESDGTWRKGEIIMDNVQVYNCSQKDTLYGAVRFEGHLGGNSRVSNSAIHNGLGVGIVVLSSNNVELENNVVVGFRQLGMILDFVRDCTITGNFIGDVFSPGGSYLNGAIDKQACVAYGSFKKQTGSATYDIVFTNNIAAGCPFAGFVAPGHSCGDNAQVNFRDNIAHSIDGYGAYMYPNPADTGNSQCFEFDHFTAYKVSESCVVTYAQTLDLKANTLTCIDNEKGISLNTGAQEADEVEITLTNSFFAGETRAKDCPDFVNCYCEPKFAMMSFSNFEDKKPLMPENRDKLQIFKPSGPSNWGGTILIENTDFYGFLGNQECGARHVIFERNPYGSDKIPPQVFDNCDFEDTSNEGFIFLERPNPELAVADACGEFPCTGAKNFQITLLGASFTGTRPGFQDSDLTFIPADDTVGGTFPSCSLLSDSQAYVCTDQKNIGFLMIESLDEDRLDRAVQPVTITNEANGYVNVLNAMRDYSVNNFYAGQKRTPRFPATILTDEDYTVEFAGTPPKNLRFELTARQRASKIKIPYPAAGSYTVYADGVEKQYTPWDDNTDLRSELTKQLGCGENRFVGIQNFLEFYITPGCVITIEPRDAILGLVRLEWTLAEFYADGGETRFVDRLAGALGIPSYRIKTIAIYEGSVVLNYFIEAEEDDTPEEAAKSLSTIQTQLVAQVTSGELNIGAPIMGLEADDVLLAGDPIPAPTFVKNADGTTTSITTTNTEVFSGEGNSAIVGDSNLWDGLESEKPDGWDEAQAQLNVEPVVDQSEPGVEPTSTTEPAVNPTPQPQPGVEPTTTTTQERETIVVTKVIEVFVEEEAETGNDSSTVISAEDQAAAEKLTVEQKKEEDRTTLMIAIPATIVGLLVIVSGIMIIRCFTCNKRKTAVIADIKTEVVHVDVEPQFVLDNDDSKNIFARPSTAPMNVVSAIEGSDAKKPDISRTQHQINLKARKAKRAKIQVAKEQAFDDIADDGFGHHDNMSAQKLADGVGSPSPIKHKHARNNSSASFLNQNTVSFVENSQTFIEEE